MTEKPMTAEEAVKEIIQCAAYDVLSGHTSRGDGILTASTIIQAQRQAAAREERETIEKNLRNLYKFGVRYTFKDPDSFVNYCLGKPTDERVVIEPVLEGAPKE